MNALTVWRWPTRIGVAVLLSAALGCAGEDGRVQPDADSPAADAVAVEVREQPVLSIAATELLARMDVDDGPIVLDVRTAEEYGTAHVPGAINIPHDQLAEHLDLLAAYRGRDIVVYCRTGRRAKHAERVLLDAGFERVWDLEGHMVEWQSSDLPLAGTCC